MSNDESLYGFLLGLDFHIHIFCFISFSPNGLEDLQLKYLLNKTLSRLKPVTYKYPKMTTKTISDERISIFFWLLGLYHCLFHFLNFYFQAFFFFFFFINFFFFFSFFFPFYINNETNYLQVTIFAFISRRSNACWSNLALALTIKVLVYFLLHSCGLKSSFSMYVEWKTRKNESQSKSHGLHNVWWR